MTIHHQYIGENKVLCRQSSEYCPEGRAIREELGLERTSPVVHANSSEAVELAYKLCQFVPEASIAHLLPPDADDTAEYPFFSEAVLYELLEKEDARTVRAYLRQVFEMLGVEWWEVEARAHTDFFKRREEKAERRKRFQERRRQRKERDATQ